MSKILFRGAIVHFADIRRAESGLFDRLHLTADFTEPVAEAMEWATIPDCCTSSKLSGELAAQTLTLTPTAKALKQHEMELECGDVSDFQVVVVKGEDGESSHRELRFVARSAQEGAAAAVESWIRVMGEGLAALKISYTEQSTLDLAGEGAGKEDPAEPGAEA